MANKIKNFVKIYKPRNCLKLFTDILNLYDCNVTCLITIRSINKGFHPNKKIILIDFYS